MAARGEIINFNKYKAGHSAAPPGGVIRIFLRQPMLSA